MPPTRFEVVALHVANRILKAIILLMITLVLILLVSPANAQESEPVADPLNSVVVTGSDQDIRIAGRLGDKLIDRLSKRVQANEKTIAGFDRRSEQRFSAFRKLVSMQDEKNDKMISRVRGERTGLLDKIATNRQEMKRLKTNLISARADLATQRKWMLLIVAVTSALFLLVLKFK